MAATLDAIWFLYNSETQERLDELTFSAAVKTLDQAVLFQSDLQNWFAWKEGMQDWTCVHQMQEFLKELKHKPESRRTAPPPIPVLKKKKTQEPPPVAFQPNMNIPEKKHIRRRYERYSIRLRVVIFKGDQSFRTYTKDLSEGGMLLENKVPETFLSGACEIFIGSPNLKENIQFVGEVIGDANNPHRFAFVEKGENSAQRMAQWFALFNALKSKAS